MPGCDLLLTGSAGFVGRHVAALAAERGLDVHAPTGDLRDPDHVAGIVADHPPATVIHLASSWRRHGAAPWRAFADDVAMAGALLPAVAAHAPNAPVLLAGTAAQYGMGGPGRLAEDEPLQPVSAYGVAKTALERAVLAAPLRTDVRVIWARSFNHVGPGQGANAPLPQWAAQVVEAERAGGGAIAVGRLDVVRDVLDVRDVAAAYLALVQAPEAAGVVNVCSGEPVSMQDVLDLLIAASDAAIAVERDPARQRSADPARVVGDPGRLRDLTDWRPRVRLEDSVSEVLAQWRGTDGSTISMTATGG